MTRVKHLKIDDTSTVVVDKNKLGIKTVKIRVLKKTDAFENTTLEIESVVKEDEDVSMKIQHLREFVEEEIDKSVLFFRK